MALRIIRKSTSQSHVEVIKGSGDGSQKPLLSILIYLEKAKDIPAFIEWIYGSDPWLQESCEFLIMKARSIEENIRPQLSVLPYNIKLITEEKETNVFKRLHVLVQEATGEICTYLSIAPEVNAHDWLQQAQQLLHSEPTCAIAGPVLTQQEKIVAAGMTLPHQSETHHLKFGDRECTFKTEAGALFFPFQSLPIDAIFASKALPISVTALPLEGLSFRKTLWLSQQLDSEQPEETIFAFQTCQIFRKAQYWVMLLPTSLPLTQEMEWPTLPHELYTQYKDHVFDETPSIYQQTGFTPQADSLIFEQTRHFSEQEAQIQDYLAKIS